MHNLTLPRLTAALAAASLLSGAASCHAPIHTYALGIAVLWGGFAALSAVVAVAGRWA